VIASNHPSGVLAKKIETNVEVKNRELNTPFMRGIAYSRKGFSTLEGGRGKGGKTAHGGWKNYVLQERHQELAPREKRVGVGTAYRFSSVQGFMGRGQSKGHIGDCLSEGTVGEGRNSTDHL